MAKNIPGILKPGMGIDLVFNIDSMTPVIRTSIIFENMERRIIVAQPRNRIHPDDKYSTLHISSLTSDTTQEKIRKGYLCSIKKFIDTFKLANGTLIPALELEYSDPLIEMNIRSAYRFTPGPAYSVMGKLVFRDMEYYSGTHFKIFDISLTGMGVLIPKRIKKTANPLLNISKKAKIKTGLLLKGTEEKEVIYTIETDLKIIRVNPNYSEKNIYVGLKFENLRPEDENSLNSFIHNGQLHEIRSQNRI